MSDEEAKVAKDDPFVRRICAPEGVTNFSHQGKNIKVGKDGTVAVPHEIADVLKAHGFKDVTEQE